MIDLVRVGFRVQGAEILRDVDLHVGGGELVAVLGPNGAGKSTLLSITAGDFAPTSGDARFNGRALASYSDLDLARDRAVLRQTTTFSFAFRVIDVVLMGRSARSFGRNTPSEIAIADRAIVEVGLSTLRERSFPTLSGGEKQRVHVARAICQIALGDEGKALLLDEPTEALDPAHQHRVLKIARAVARKGVAVIAILHDVNLAIQYADRILILSKGSRAAFGAPSEVINEALFRDVFGVTAHVGSAAWDKALPWVGIIGASDER